MRERLNPELIRRYADGEELNAGEVAQVEDRMACDPEARAQIGFERELRERIRRVLEQTAEAPDTLRASVEAAIAAEPAASRAEATADDEPEPSPAPRRSVWASPQRANFFYVAATIALIVGAVLFGIFTPPIDHRRAVDPSADAAMYALTEHDRCVRDPEHLSRKAVWTEHEEATRQLSRLLQVAVPVIDLSGSGYDFIGAGECQVPGQVPSGHLSYVRRDESSRPRPPMASIFVVTDVGQYAAAGPFTRFQWYLDEWENTTHPVLQMTDGNVFYFLVCCDSDDQKPLARAVSEAARESVP